MKSSEYIKESKRTAANELQNRKTQERISGDKIIDLLHAGIGLATESGEVLDALKKHLYYGKELDLVNINEEVGDLMFYCAMALRATGSSFEEVMQKNVDKLKIRYPVGFDEFMATNRNIEKERKSLESFMTKKNTTKKAKPLKKKKKLTKKTKKK